MSKIPKCSVFLSEESITSIQVGRMLWSSCYSFTDYFVSIYFKNIYLICSRQFYYWFLGIVQSVGRWEEFPLNYKEPPFKTNIVTLYLYSYPVLLWLALSKEFVSCFVLFNLLWEETFLSLFLLKGRGNNLTQGTYYLGGLLTSDFWDTLRMRVCVHVCVWEIKTKQKSSTAFIHTLIQKQKREHKSEN